MKPLHRLLPSATLLLAACWASPASAAGLGVAGDGFERDGAAYRAVGVNYYDAFLRTLRQPGNFTGRRTSLDGPTDTSYLDGLDGLRDAGVPFLRFNAGGFFAEDYDLYRTDRARYLGQLRAVVDAAGDRGLGVIPSVFWNTDEFAELSGETRSAWADAGSATRALADAYARDVVGTLKSADNVLLWEFGNEFNLQQDLGRDPGITSAGVRDAIAAFAGVVAELDPQRTTTTGHSISRPAADALRDSPGSFSRDTREEFREITLDDHAGVGVISVHAYQHSALGLSVNDSAADDATRFDEPDLTYPEVIAELMDASKAAGKPLFLGEFGVAEGSDFGDPDAPATEREQLQYLLQTIVEQEVPLSALWVYDRLGGGAPDYTVTTTNDRAYQLALIAEANRRLAVPEPGGLALLGLGGLLLIRK